MGVRGYGSICDAIQRYNGNERNPQGCAFPAVWASGNFVSPNFFDKLEKVCDCRLHTSTCGWLVLRVVGSGACACLRRVRAPV